MKRETTVQAEAEGGHVRRMVIVLPCCIGDVVMATAALGALRRAHPDAHIAWAVGTWSRPALEGHPHLDALLDTGDAANPVRTAGGMLHMVRLLRAGRFDALVSLMRSPGMSIAALLSGIPVRAGLDSGGRGFGYTHRARIDPAQPRHEAELYLDVVRALGIDSGAARAFVPVDAQAQAIVRMARAAAGAGDRYLVVHPGGGRNPGMMLDAKRYPPEALAQVADALADRMGCAVVVIGGAGDRALVEAVRARLRAPSAALIGMAFRAVAALAVDALVYIGSDTGMTHLAAAAGAPTVAIFGPTDPRRYAPFGTRVLALWQPVETGARGVTDGAPTGWDWARDGIAPADAVERISVWLGTG
jgi:heptosyltransferase-2/heptosyltransferase-3